MQILYYQYVVKRGVTAPWLTKIKKAIDSIGGERIGEFAVFSA